MTTKDCAPRIVVVQNVWIGTGLVGKENSSHTRTTRSETSSQHWQSTTTWKSWSSMLSGMRIEWAANSRPIPEQRDYDDGVHPHLFRIALWFELNFVRLWRRGVSSREKRSAHFVTISRRVELNLPIRTSCTLNRYTMLITAVLTRTLVMTYSVRFVHISSHIFIVMTDDVHENSVYHATFHRQKNTKNLDAIRTARWHGWGLSFHFWTHYRIVVLCKW